MSGEEQQAAVCLTVPVVKEFGDVERAAGRPRQRFVEADEQRRHQVMTSQIPKESLTCLGVIVRHAQHVTCRR